MFGLHELKATNSRVCKERKKPESPVHLYFFVSRRVIGDETIITQLRPTHLPRAYSLCTGRGFIATAMSNESFVEDSDEVIKTLNAEICMCVVLQVTVMVIYKQHSCCAGGVASSHIVDAVADHDEILASIC